MHNKPAASTFRFSDDVSTISTYRFPKDVSNEIANFHCVPTGFPQSLQTKRARMPEELGGA